MPSPFMTPWASRLRLEPYDYGPTMRIADLMQEGGRQRAEAILRRGDIWAGLLQQLGQIPQQVQQMKLAEEERGARAEERRAMADYREQQTAGLKRREQMETEAFQRNQKQDAAFMDLLNQNPSAADVVSSAYKIYGPERGAKVAAGYVSFQEMGDKRGEDALKSLPHIIDGFEAMGEAGRAQTWPILRQKVIAAGLFNEQLPEQYTPDLAPDIIKFGEGLKGTVQKTANFQHVETAEGFRAFDPTTGTYGPVQAAGKPSAADDKREWIQRGTEVLKLRPDQIQPGDVPYANPKQSLKNVISGQAEELSDFDTSLDDVKAIRTALGEKGATGAAASAQAAIPDWVTSLTGWGVDAKKTQATIDRVKQVIGKTLEGGVLRKEDEVKYEKILPKIADAPEVVVSKLNGLEAAIQKRKVRRLDALEDAGFDVSRFRARVVTPEAAAPAEKTPERKRNPFR